MCRAKASAATITSSLPPSITRDTKPISLAVAASKSSPVKQSSRKSDSLPTTFGSRCGAREVVEQFRWAVCTFVARRVVADGRAPSHLERAYVRRQPQPDLSYAEVRVRAAKPHVARCDQVDDGAHARSMHGRH